ncbi:dynamin family protein [Massilia sp. DWR3-1-1]|uniref:dynamin family protein n=1 Tax=Massilia sp. DWR3-1-1 TaxID=2804559 RepID=UPI003CEE1884
MVQDFQQYGAWRQGVVTALESYQMWVNAAELTDGATEQRIARALLRLADDKLSVAFVAEFSRGKSELINALFFADYGQRLLPSAAGRTTMCPTELLYDPACPPSLRLLPIETRASTRSTSDYRDEASAWTVLPLSLDAGDQMTETFKQVSLTKRVSAAEAQRYGLYDAADPDSASALDAHGMVEVSLWRHAIINFPHPLLKQGLVIIDTPGLNAIGTEPELTLNLIPNAHAVLFILAAETGVTKSDIELWRSHIGAGRGRIVVLNKIDAMWDELKTDAAIDADIARQQASVAQLLALSARQVYPVSAQKALVAKINQDLPLLEKSRLGALEAALFNELIPAKKDIIRAQLQDDMAQLARAQHAMLGARGRDLVEQLQELRSLRGKNQGVIAHMMRRVEIEKKEFDASLVKLAGTRAVFAHLSTELFTAMGMATVQEDVDAVRAAMQASRFATGMRAPVKVFFEQARAHLDTAGLKVQEIGAMMESMYKKFSAEHGLALTLPMLFSFDKYRAEIDAIEAVYQKQFGTATLLLTGRAALVERFFDAIASRVRRTWNAANADVEAWLKVIMAPLEAQIRQHKDQLKHRLSSISRIHDATDSLEQKITAFETTQGNLLRVEGQLRQLAAGVAAALAATPAVLEVAA